MDATTLEAAENLVIELNEQRGIKSSAEDLAKEYQRELIVILGTESLTQVKAQTPDANLTATLVSPEGIDIDEEKLKKKIGAKKWKLIAPPKLDRDLLNALLESGDINVADVAACSTTVPRTPFIKVTTRKRPTQRATKKTAAAK